MLETIGDVTLINEFWDCECEHNYIQPKSRLACPVCGATQDEQPDSHLDVVLKQLFQHHFIKEVTCPTERSFNIRFNSHDEVAANTVLMLGDILRNQFMPYCSDGQFDLQFNQSWCDFTFPQCQMADVAEFFKHTRILTATIDDELGDLCLPQPNIDPLFSSETPNNLHPYLPQPHYALLKQRIEEGIINAVIIRPTNMSIWFNMKEKKVQRKYFPEGYTANGCNEKVWFFVGQKKQIKVLASLANS